MERAVGRVPAAGSAAWKAAWLYVTGGSRNDAPDIAAMLLEREHGVSVDLFGPRVGAQRGYLRVALSEERFEQVIGAVAGPLPGERSASPGRDSEQPHIAQSRSAATAKAAIDKRRLLGHSDAATNASTALSMSAARIGDTDDGLAIHARWRLSRQWLAVTNAASEPIRQLPEQLSPFGLPPRCSPRSQQRASASTSS